MALATQCPHCNTIFRVAADQLKLRGGIVRCGKCSEVFDGNATLITDGVQPKQEPQVTPVVVEDDDRPIYTLDFDTTFDPYGIIPEPEPEPEPVREVDENQKDLFDDPAVDEEIEKLKSELGFTTEPVTKQEPGAPLPAAEPVTETQAEEAETAPTPEPEPQPEAAPEPQAEPQAEPEPGPEPVPEVAPDPVMDPDYEPEFLLRERRREQASRITRPLMVLGVLLLLGGLVVQGILNFHNQLAAYHPPLKPLLASACKSLGCKVVLPMQAEALSVETGQLEPVAGNTFSYTTLLRNSSKSAQAWPYLELALTDAEDRQLVRRVLAPKDYLPAGADLAKGFAARTEQPVRIYFELKDVKASGYRIAVFYP
jgi:predicted Zn finger-like uncharacterized protein